MEFVMIGYMSSDWCYGILWCFLLAILVKAEDQLNNNCWNGIQIINYIYLTDEPVYLNLSMTGSESDRKNCRTVY